MNHTKLIFLVMITVPGSTQQRKAWMGLDFKKCDDEAQMAYSINGFGYVVLCPQYLPPLKEAIVGNNKDKDYSSSTTNINDLASAMSVTLFHELLHVFYDYSESSIFYFRLLNRLIFCDHLVFGGKDEVYKYDGCLERAAENVMDVLNMPDCVALYAFCEFELLNVKIAC